MTEEMVATNELVFPGLDGGLLAGDNVVAGDDVTGFIPAS